MKHLASIIALPVSAALLVPMLLISGLGYTLFWGLESKAMGVLLITGLLFVGSGLILLFSTVSLFILKGEGTIAPWAPTNRLLTIGVYAYVRNPMITGVFLALIGESMMFGSLLLTIYTIVFVLGNLVYTPLVEEPRLERRFGKEYLVYKEKVPRWIPHLFQKDRRTTEKASQD